MLVMFEDESLGKFLENEEIGDGDKIERIVMLLEGNPESLINRIRDIHNVTNSSVEFVNNVVTIITTEGKMIITMDHKEKWVSTLPATPPTLVAGESSIDPRDLANLSSDSLPTELNRLINRLGLYHTGYLLEKLVHIFKISGV